MPSEQLAHSSEHATQEPSVDQEDRYFEIHELMEERGDAVRDRILELIFSERPQELVRERMHDLAIRELRVFSRDDLPQQEQDRRLASLERQAKLYEFLDQIAKDILPRFEDTLDLSARMEKLDALKRKAEFPDLFYTALEEALFESAARGTSKEEVLKGVDRLAQLQEDGGAGAETLAQFRKDARALGYQDLAAIRDDWGMSVLSSAEAKAPESGTPTATTDLWDRAGILFGDEQRALLRNAHGLYRVLVEQQGFSLTRRLREDNRPIASMSNYFEIYKRGRYYLAEHTELDREERKLLQSRIAGLGKFLAGHAYQEIKDAVAEMERTAHGESLSHEQIDLDIFVWERLQKQMDQEQMERPDIKGAPTEQTIGVQYFETALEKTYERLRAEMETVADAQSPFDPKVERAMGQIQILRPLYDRIQQEALDPEHIFGYGEPSAALRDLKELASYSPTAFEARVQAMIDKASQAVRRFDDRAQVRVDKLWDQIKPARQERDDARHDHREEDQERLTKRIDALYEKLHQLYDIQNRDSYGKRLEVGRHDFGERLDLALSAKMITQREHHALQGVQERLANLYLLQNRDSHGHLLDAGRQEFRDRLDMAALHDIISEADHEKYEAFLKQLAVAAAEASREYDEQATAYEKIMKSIKEGTQPAGLRKKLESIREKSADMKFYAHAHGIEAMTEEEYKREKDARERVRSET